MPDKIIPSDEMMKFRASLTPEEQQLFDYVYLLDSDQAHIFLGFALWEYSNGNRGHIFELLAKFKKHFFRSKGSPE